MQKENATILLGDCLEVLKTLPDNSVDAIVTDPPYGLGKEPAIADVMRSWLEKDYHEITGKGFMGKEWDAFVPQPVIWREVFRVLKPGGHCLVACGTRTQDLMALGLRFVGFEIRDCIAWVYGSGFPKSLDIGKAIDKAAGAEREVVGESLTRSQKNSQIYSGSKIHEEFGEFVPTTTPATEAAKQWDGWHTALKPAIELWTLCRKPLAEKTIAENVLTWGTGGLNIDGCRVKCEGKPLFTQNKNRNKDEAASYCLGGSNRTGEISTEGRFPANLIHDGSDEVTAGFPQSNSSKPSENMQYGANRDGRENAVFGKGLYSTTPNLPPYADSGSASRFFYCAKASKSERNAGLEGFEERQTFGDKGETYQGLSNSKHPNKNHHPTVKPLALMRYLCRLITPPNGIVLDPFTGSGSTGCGAIWEGFNFIGIERESDYAAIAQARITHAQKEKAADAAIAQTNLF